MKNVITDWLINEPRPTVICVAISAIALVLSLIGCAWKGLDVAWIAIVLCGVPIVVGAIKAMVTEFNIKADVLVSIALVACIITGEWFAAGEVAIIMQIGSLLEDYTANRAKKGLSQLIDLTPRTARRIIVESVKLKVESYSEEVIPVEQVKNGDMIRILAGETVPVDGIIVKGMTSVNQSVMTGESIPVDKKLGDELISGTMNQMGVVVMRATKTSDDSSLQRMIKLAQETDADKAPIVRLADRWASWLVLVALLCAVGTWFITDDFMRAVTVLVVFCPCAFILATPTAVAAAIGNATKYGILIRTGDALERLAGVCRVAFDKTGTLTYGRPEVVGITPLSDGMNEEEILHYAAIAESHSEHPLGKAIVKKVSDGNIDILSDRAIEKAAITALDSMPEVIAGEGIKAKYKGKEIFVGRADNNDEQVKKWFDKGATVVTVIIDGREAGIIALADTVREDASAVITSIKSKGIEPTLLTGDNNSAARTIAQGVGISDVHSDLRPEDKMTFIRQYNDANENVCMVGDGVNDALALRTAYVGVAMGGVGSDIAVESADVVLVSDDIRHLPYLFCLAAKSMSKVKQNIIVSMIINFGAIILSVMGVLTPITGALVHNVGSVFVVVNAALLLRMKDK